MTSSDIRAPVDVADVIAGLRYGLAFGPKGHLRSVKKRTSRCRQVLEKIPGLSAMRLAEMAS